MTHDGMDPVCSICTCKYAACHVSCGWVLEVEVGPVAILGFALENLNTVFVGEVPERALNGPDGPVGTHTL